MANIETDLQKQLNTKGYKTMKNGWSDLLTVDSKGVPSFIEAKDEGDRLRGNQKEMLQLLANLGFNVFIVSKDTQKYKFKKANTAPLHEWDNPQIQQNLAETLSRIEKEILTDTLIKCDYENSKIADYLGLTSRQLRYKLQKYDLKSQSNQ